ncbi:MAG: CYTH domain-containing protein [Chloroflexi bacterium]|nr:CYTH domain-containing protein [Chloroflexota bacterium]
MRLQDNLEVELKLTVTGNDPDKLLDEIATIVSLGGVRLADAREHQLRDIYWDTADYGLRARKLSLRLREIDGRQVFTVKGGTSSSEGLFRRYELETPASAQNWQDVCAVFHDEGVDLARVNGLAGAGTSPDDWLRAAGLHPTQDRSTRRTAIHAYDDAHGDQPLAELALDRTRFDFGRVLVDYWEIEIEELGNHGDEVPRLLGQALRERYPDRLEPSTMGKYSRGLAIERELRTTGQL